MAERNWSFPAYLHLCKVRNLTAPMDLKYFRPFLFQGLGQFHSFIYLDLFGKKRSSLIIVNNIYLIMKSEKWNKIWILNAFLVIFQIQNYHYLTFIVEMSHLLYLLTGLVRGEARVGLDQYPGSPVIKCGGLWWIFVNISNPTTC